MVYVLSKTGKPLMPTERHGKVRRLLQDGKAKVVSVKPFTIQLLYETTEFTQAITLGIDSGYKNIGISAISEKQELFSGELELLENISKRLTERKMYRCNRRNRLRYRQPRFNNRTRPQGWLAPSMQHKLDSHINVIEKIKKILPITQINIEVAAFDIQKIKNPDIQGEQYQNGEQKDFWNVREYVLHRDNHTCQLCKGKGKILEVHHIIPRSKGGTDRPDNLITLCSKCHKKVHRENISLKPVTTYKPETFMSVIRWKIVNQLRDAGYKVNVTYGYITKSKRIDLGLEKTHYNDAFCIAGGSGQKHIKPVNIIQVRRNNRSLEKFYDAKYLDARTGKTSAGKEFATPKTIHKLNADNLHRFRSEKLKKGRRQIRKQRYNYHPHDLIIYNNQKCIVKGVQNKGSYIRIRIVTKDMEKVVQTKHIQPYLYRRGICVA